MAMLASAERHVAAFPVTTTPFASYAAIVGVEKRPRPRVNACGVIVTLATAPFDVPGELADVSLPRDAGVVAAMVCGPSIDVVAASLEHAVTIAAATAASTNCNRIMLPPTVCAFVLRAL